MKYRKKPVVIEATQWFKNGDHPEDDVFRPFEDTGKIPTIPREGKIVRYFRHPNISGETICRYCGKKMDDHGWIDTLSSEMTGLGRYTPEYGHKVCPGDFVITGVAGEKYPCKPDIFEKTYEPVQEA
jgi:hypothetical protein